MGNGIVVQHLAQIDLDVFHSLPTPTVVVNREVITFQKRMHLAVEVKVPLWVNEIRITYKQQSGMYD